MRTLILFLLIIIAQAGKSQGPARNYHQIGLLLGTQQSHMLDRQFSPLIHSADELSASLWYNASQNRSGWNVSLDISTGILFPTDLNGRKIYNTTQDLEGNITTDSILVTGKTRTAIFQIGYDYKVVNSLSWTISSGASVRDQIMYPNSFTNMGIMNSASLMFDVQATFYTGPRMSLKGGLSIPVIGFNTRFPYSGTVSRPNQTLLEAFFDGGTHFVTLDRYKQVNINLGWQLDLSSAIGIGLDYDFMWQHYTIPASLKSYSQRLGANLHLTF